MAHECRAHDCSAPLHFFHWNAWFGTDSAAIVPIQARSYKRAREASVARSRLGAAAQLGDLTSLKAQLADGADPNVRDDCGDTPLHQAVRAKDGLCCGDVFKEALLEAPERIRSAISSLAGSKWSALAWIVAHGDSYESTQSLVERVAAAARVSPAARQKALLEAPKEELHSMGEELYDLGLGLCADPLLPVAMVHVGVMLLHASGQTLGEEVALVWRERGAQAETAPLARFLSKQLAAMRSRP